VPTSDPISIRRAIAYFLDTFEKQTAEGQAINSIGEELFAIALDQPFRFPATFTFVLRAFGALEVSIQGFVNRNRISLQSKCSY
jgi:predicted unusual protein kinase regulating ubiquinone biosynthesis (AarF/ABC1/UbiB family)